MEEEPSKKPHKKHSYWAQIVIRSKEEFKLHEIITEAIVGAMLVFFAIISGVSSRDEMGELILLCIGGAFLTPFIGFLIRCLFVTPGKLNKENEEKLEIAEGKLNEGQNVKPLEVEALPAKKIIDNFKYASELVIHNPNQPISGIALRLLKVEPPMKGTGTVTTDDCDLHRVKFSFNDLPDNVLKRNQTGHICIFNTERNQKSDATTVKFDGQWATSWNDEFTPKENQQYILTFEISCDGPPTMQAQFKLSFPSGPHIPPFTLEKITPPAAAHSLDNGVGEINDKTKKLRDPASVIILLCLSASLLVLSVAQRIQISKLNHPPQKQGSAAKPIPDKIIPRPVISNIPPRVSPPQVTNVEPPIQFETSNPSTESGDSESELAKIKAKKLADKAAQDEANRKQQQSDSDNRWKEMLPIFNNCIETFYNILKNAAARRNEGIAKTDSYFRCLPPTIDYELGETNIAEIRFSNQTNIDFRIAITSDNQFRGLRISGSCGYFEIHHANIYVWHKCNIIIHTQGIHEDQTVELGQTHDLIEEDLRLLKDGQIAYLSQTNHEQ